MYTEILIPLDGSPRAEEVLPYAELFATAFEIPVDLLRIVDPETVSVAGADALENARREGASYLEAMARSLTGRLSTPVRCTTEKGNPAERIVAVAAARKNPLIAMSTHGRSGVRRWLLGSVTEKTVEATAHPLLLIRARRKETSGNGVTLSQVLVPLDGSPVAEQVLPHVSRLARTMGLDVVLLRAYEVQVRGHSPRMRQIRETVRDAAQNYLDEKAQQLKNEGVASVSCRVERGDAAGRIVRVARELPDNLIAMSTHGRSGVRRWVLGSVTSRIVRHSKDPVLVIPAARQSAG